MSQQIAEELARDIQEGELAPGTRVQQVDVAKRFGVSTTPVREAFAQLQSVGLLRIDAFRGAVVFRPTLDDLLECIEIRKPLEELAAARAVPRLTDEDIAELESLFEELNGTEDPQRWVSLNDRFHMAIYGKAGSPRLVAIINQLRDASAAYLYMLAEGGGKHHRGDEGHAEIMRACRDRDPAAIAKHTREHLASTIDDLMQSDATATLTSSNGRSSASADEDAGARA